MSAQNSYFQEKVYEYAKWFAFLSEDQQVEFIQQTILYMKAKIKGMYPEKTDGSVNLTARHCWYALGSHIKNCPCVKHDVKDWLAAIVEGSLTGTSR